MKYLLILLSLILITDSIDAQTKNVGGDTTFWYSRTKPLMDRIESKDLLASESDFNFRFRNNGQVVEISKDGNAITGSLTNYVYKLGKNSRTIYKKEILGESVAANLYGLVNSSKIRNLESDKKIEGWRQGSDGITYIIEHADKSNYWYKTYWTPSVQDSLISEAITVNDFMADISTLLDLNGSAKKFKDKLPRNSCYSNGSMAQFCYVSNSYLVGYSGSNRLPLGYAGYAYIGYIRDLKTDMRLWASHQMDTHGDYDIAASVGKGYFIFFNNASSNDYVQYGYRQRRYKDIEDGVKYVNHNIMYGINLKSTSFAAGVDFLKGSKSKTGVVSLSIRAYRSLGCMCWVEFLSIKGKPTIK